MTFNHANVVSSLPTNACCTNWIIDDGNVDKIPAKIMIEIPLPTPNSPSQIKNAVPVVKTTAINK